MRRKLLFGERMLLGDGTEPFNAVIPFRLRGTFKEEDIQHALSRLQGKHPWLRALISHDDNNVPWYEVREKHLLIPIRIVPRKGEDDWQDESRKEWQTLFQYAEQPLLLFVWIKGEEV